MYRIDNSFPILSGQVDHPLRALEGMAWSRGVPEGGILGTMNK